MPSPFGKRRFILFLLFLAFVGVLNMASESVRSSVTSVLAPLQAGLWQGGTATSAFLAGMLKGPALEGQILALQEENTALLEELVRLSDIEKENARLREALGIAEKETWSLLFAEVVGKEMGKDVLLVNKGRRDGLEKGMPVITQSGVAAGSVEEVWEQTSRVSLLSAEGRVSDVKIQGSESLGVLKGQGGFRALLDFIPREQTFAEGELLVTSALGGVFPDGFLVGEIQDVQKSDIAAFQGGSVELFFHPRKENSLFIITNYP